MIEQSLLLGVILSLPHLTVKYPCRWSLPSCSQQKRCAYSVVDVRELTVPGEWQVVKGCVPLVGVSLFSSALAVY